MSVLTIKEMDKDERPRERLIKYGKELLSNEELLSIIFKTGCKEYNVRELSSIVLKQVGGLEGLKNISINNLKKIKGLGEVKIIELLASLELGKRVYYEKEKFNIKLNNSNIIYNYFKDLFIDEKQEYFYAIYLNPKSILITYKMLFKGTVNTSTVHPREVFKYAFLESAYSIIVFHNHPSGDATPSIQDEELTSSLISIGKVVGIPVVDHLIFGDNSYYSFYEKTNVENV